MDVVQEIFSNKVLISAALSWFIAQVLKTIIHLILCKELRMERMVGAGGMPSCHSATVCALATATGIECGVDSGVFGIAVMFAIVTMYDAMGVRRETGIQAVVINEMIALFKEMGKSGKNMSADDKLKEFIGHTPIQVMVGASLGVTIALIICLSA